MTYFGWAGDRPLALLLEQGSQLSQLHCVSRPVAGGSPVALGHRGSLVRRHQDGTSGPSGFSLGRGWGLSAPGARELPVMGTGGRRAVLGTAAPALHPASLEAACGPSARIFCALPGPGETTL